MADIRKNHPELSDKNYEIIKLTIDILEKELVPVLKEYEKKGEFPKAVSDKLFEAGLFGANIPERFGGLGMDYVGRAVLMEEMAKIDAGFAFSFLSATAQFDCMPAGATEEQLAYVAKKQLEEGTFMSFALTEPEAGSDAGSIRTTYREEGDEYVLNGTKCFITNPDSGINLVFATRDRSLGSKGVSAFLVETKHGMKGGSHEDKMGLRLSNTGDVIFEDVRIPKENLVGKIDKGIRIAMSGLDVARALNMSYAVGIAQRALEEAVKYAKLRVQFGKPIIRNQGLQFKLADMQAKIFACRAMVMEACRELDEGKEIMTKASCIKFYVSEVLTDVCIDAIQIFGGYGYSREYPVEKLLRDIKIFSIFEGTNEINRQMVGRALEEMY